MILVVRSKHQRSQEEQQIIYIVLKNSSGTKILVRIYGENTENFIDRYKENLILEKLGHLDFISQLYAIFKNGIVYQYLEGKHYSHNEYVENSEKVAKKLCQLHNEFIEEFDKNGDIWHKFEDLYLLAEESIFKGWKLSLNEFKNEVQLIKNVLDGKKKIFDLALTHNDLNRFNFLVDGENISFLDFEYASYNYVEYEIGNVFCEYLGLDLKVERYPNLEEQKKFLNAYIEEYNKISSQSNEKKPEISFSLELYSKVNLFALVSDLFWTLWAAIQNRKTTIEFNFLKYGTKRLQIYLDSKEHFLSLAQKIEKTNHLEKGEYFKKIIICDFEINSN